MRVSRARSDSFFATAAGSPLQNAMALGPELLSMEALMGMLGDEIDQLRRTGETDAQIAQRIGDAIGRPVAPALLVR